MGYSGFQLIQTLVLTLFISNIPSSHQLGINIRQSDSLKWGSCAAAPSWGDAASLTCANFTVPLDWTNPTNGQNAVLYVAKRRAASGSPRGTIYINPGGPGGSGLDLLVDIKSQLLSNITGGMFDIVSWDPRGVGRTSPSISCFDDEGDKSAEQVALSFWETYHSSTLNVRSSPDQSDIDSFLANATNVETYMKTYFQKCIDKHKDDLKHVGTVATVRDLVALVDAIEGTGSPIHYWGFSYGTVIGSYLLDLYPDRVGRVVLDGVMDSTVYSHDPPHLSFGDSIQDTEMALQAFYDACAAAGPNLCPIATPGATGATIRKFSNDLIDASHGKRPFENDVFITPWLIRMELGAAARYPSHWELLAQVLQSFHTAVHSSDRSSTRNKLLARHFDHLPVKKRQIRDMSQANALSSAFAISCGDAADDKGVTTATVFNEIVRITKEVSNVDGPMGFFDPSMFCHLWTVRAVERHSNQGSPRLANPVIVVGNTYDSATPLAYARKLVTRLNDAGTRQAALVQHDGSGHLSLEMNSACTYSIVQKYFFEGVVPEDTLCGVNFNGFVGDQTSSNHNASTSILSMPLASASARSQSNASALTLTSTPPLILLFFVGLMSGFLTLL